MRGGAIVRSRREIRRRRLGERRPRGAHDEGHRDRAETRLRRAALDLGELLCAFGEHSFRGALDPLADFVDVSELHAVFDRERHFARRGKTLARIFLEPAQNDRVEIVR